MGKYCFIPYIIIDLLFSFGSREIPHEYVLNCQPCIKLLCTSPVLGCSMSYLDLLLLVDIYAISSPFGCYVIIVLHTLCAYT